MEVTVEWQQMWTHPKAGKQERRLRWLCWKKVCQRKKWFCRLGARYLCQVLYHRANFLGQKGKFHLLLFIVNLNLGFCRLMSPLTDKNLLKVKITGNSTQASRRESNIRPINFFQPCCSERWARARLNLQCLFISVNLPGIERSIPRWTRLCSNEHTSNFDCRGVDKLTLLLKFHRLREKSLFWAQNGNNEIRQNIITYDA